ncbi:hypothetical protein MN116_005217 [Schistosoma mekongi]|uniref:RRM domain-containing protein n=1 Tax=Schistosoma mekongi TaxID=38744 RepID=A0AAE1ZE88_SCHME|nr:hypothetical protein MN116_005217 [Schistosoma mekongi]
MPTSSNDTYIYPESTSHQVINMRSPNSNEQNRTESMKDLADCVEQNSLREFLSNESIQCSNSKSVNINTTLSSMNDITMKSDQNSGKNFSKTNYSTYIYSHHQNGNVGGGVEKMSRTNLYIKGLPVNFDDNLLRQLPPDQTKIKSVKAATDEDTKCRGYGFIDFVSEDAANEALQQIKESHPSFTIKFAKENEKDKTNLYVTNLPRTWTTKDSDQLKAVFERFGHIQSAFVMMERLTNKTTGVGFVRFVNEQDAMNALESLKLHPLTLPDCSVPIEAKFADKHNPDTRRRRYPVTAAAAAAVAAAASATMIANVNYNSLLNSCPLYTTTPNGLALTSHDTLASLLNTGLVSPSIVNNQLANFSALQKSATDFTSRLNSDLLNGFIQPAKFPNDSLCNPSSNNTTNNGNTNVNHNNSNNTNGNGLASDFNGATRESNLAALAAAATIFCGSPTPNSFMNNCLRSNPTVNGANLSTGLLSANQIALLGTPTIPSPDTKLFDPSIYGCSLYGADYFRPQQHPQSQQQQQSHQQSQKQQQQLLSVAMAAMANPALQGCVYPSTADLTTFNNTYHSFLNSHNSTTIPIPTDPIGNCLPGGTPENITTALNGTIYASHQPNPHHQSQQPQQPQQQNTLLSPTPIPGSVTHIPETLANSRLESGLYQWLIPSHLLKTNTNNGSNNDCHVTIPSPAFSLNPTNHLIGLEKTNRHVQMLL